LPEGRVMILRLKKALDTKALWLEAASSRGVVEKLTSKDKKKCY